MIVWIAIISLIIIGLALIVIELIFIPGTTIVGIIGLLCILSGLFMTFNNYGYSTGWIATGATAVFSAGVIVYAFRSGAWSKFALKDTIDSKVNEDKPLAVTTGDEGIARSALRPIGKGEFNDIEIEVRSLGDLIPTGTRIKIIKIENRKVFVEPIT